MFLRILVKGLWVQSRSVQVKHIRPTQENILQQRIISAHASLAPNVCYLVKSMYLYYFRVLPKLLPTWSIIRYFSLKAPSKVSYSCLSLPATHNRNEGYNTLNFAKAFQTLKKLKYNMLFKRQEKKSKKSLITQLKYIHIKIIYMFLIYFQVKQSRIQFTITELH